MVTTPEPTHLEPVVRNKRRHRSEKPVHCTEGGAPARPDWREACTQHQRSSAVKKLEKSLHAAPKIQCSQKTKAT